jgi:hypothetical protein
MLENPTGALVEPQLVLPVPVVIWMDCWGNTKSCDVNQWWGNSVILRTSAGGTPPPPTPSSNPLLTTYGKPHRALPSSKCYSSVEWTLPIVHSLPPNKIANPKYKNKMHSLGIYIYIYIYICMWLWRKGDLVKFSQGKQRAFFSNKKGAWNQ